MLKSFTEPRGLQVKLSCESNAAVLMNTKRSQCQVRSACLRRTLMHFSLRQHTAAAGEDHGLACGEVAFFGEQKRDH